MPTTSKRRRWVAQAIECFRQQDIYLVELIIGGDAGLRAWMPANPFVRFVELPDIDIGRKRNLINEHARGKYIAHWDDDDWYPPWRLATQLNVVRICETRISGHRKLIFWDAADGRFWRYQCSPEVPGACGATLFYERSLWKEHPFDEQPSGEDWRWCSRHAEPVADPTGQICIASVHAGNTSRRQYVSPWWVPVEDYKPPIEASPWLDAARLIAQPVE